MKLYSIRLISVFTKMLITLRNSGGFLNIPTPGGVPVRITSPGRRVKNCVSQTISSSVLNINWRVLESYIYDLMNY